MGPHSAGSNRFSCNHYLVLLVLINVILALHLLRTPGTGSRCHPGQHIGSGALSSTSKYAVDPDSIKLFVGVLSRAKNKAVRQAIREGYGSDKRLVRVMFFVLRPESNHTFRALRDEAAQYEDVVVVSGTNEAYHNTTYSVLEIFRAASLYSNRITHLLKTDEDCYVRVSKLIDILAADGRPWLYGGYPMTDQKDNIVVKRDPKHKWYVPYDNWASDEPVPAYAWGIGALLSVDLVKHIAAGMPHVLSAPDNLMRIEDIAVGIWVDEVLKEQGQQLAKVTMPIDQFMCWNHEVISHLGYLDFVKNDIELAAAHRCMFAHRDSCCDKATLLRMLIDQELQRNREPQLATAGHAAVAPAAGQTSQQLQQ